MFKKIFLFIFFIIVILFQFSNTQFSLAQVWDSCPFGLVDDPYPGECGRYIDTNQDGICDLSQPNPKDSTTGIDKNTVALNVNEKQTDDTVNISILPEEEDYSVEISGSQLRGMTITEIARLWEIDADSLLQRLSENLLLENHYTIISTINELRAEMRFSPSLVKMVAEELKNQSNPQKEEPGLNQTKDAMITLESQKEFVTQQVIFPDYNLIEIGLITLLLYLGGKLLAARLKVSSAKEKKFWNILLLISFIGSAGTGFILILIRDFNWFRLIDFNFLFWHVELSIAMGLIGIFHALWHVKYYWKIFYKQK